MLEERGIITYKGAIVEAIFVDAPCQRNNRDENDKIKNGEVPREWKNDPHKRSPKDTDARWTKNGDEKRYVHNGHVNVDAYSKMMLVCAVTTANAYDSNKVEIFLRVAQSQICR